MASERCKRSAPSFLVAASFTQRLAIKGKWSVFNGAHWSTLYDSTVGIHLFGARMKSMSEKPGSRQSGLPLVPGA
eukprot:10728315-Alexandrium_andersonii.AAC.1